MPFIKRRISPVLISRQNNNNGQPPSDSDAVRNPSIDYDLTAVSNTTLCGALSQLSCLLTTAHTISSDLHTELEGVTGRMGRLAGRVAGVKQKVEKLNARKVQIREYANIIIYLLYLFNYIYLLFFIIFVYFYIFIIFVYLYLFIIFV